MDNIRAKENLEDAVSILNQCLLTNFLVDGTLLGAIREKDFIKHDTDVDLGVMMKEWDLSVFSRVVKEMMQKGFILYHSFGIFGKHFEVSWYRSGIKVDFFFYYYEGNKIRFNAFLNGGRDLPKDIITYEYDAQNFNVLAEITFKGSVYKIPSFPEEVLKQKYGDQWRIPQVKWDWAYGPKNVVGKV